MACLHLQNLYFQLTAVKFMIGILDDIKLDMVLEIEKVKVFWATIMAVKSPIVACLALLTWCLSVPLRTSPIKELWLNVIL